MSKLNVHDISNISTTSGNINIGNIFYHSADWQKMQAQHDKLLQRIQKYPDDEEFKIELDDLIKQMDDFKRDVLKLAEEFQRISIDTERLKLAYDHFQKGEFNKARAILDTDKMGDEQDHLLQRKQNINTELDTINEQLAHNATEFLIAARLTAIDYDLKEARIPKSCEYFERALQANRSPEYLFEYALFLQDNNQFQDAERYYREVLAIYESLAKQQPNVYLPNVAQTQNNLANLLFHNPQHRKLAQRYYEQALTIRQQFAKQNPTRYLHYVADTQNNLANLLSYNPQQRQLARQYYEQVLAIYQQLVEQQPNVYLPHIATIQNNLATLLSHNPQQRQLAQQYYEQALTIRQQLAKQQPNVYLPDVAMTQNNLAALLSYDSQQYQQAQWYYEQALIIRQQLAKQNPHVYLPLVANIQNNLALLLRNNLQQRQQAQQYLEQALIAYQQLAKQQPNIYLSYVANTQNNLANLLSEDPQQRQLVQQYYDSALKIRRNLVETYENPYRENLVQTLSAYGCAHLQWGEPSQALLLLQEAVEQLQPLLVIAPETYGKWDNELQDLLQEIADMIGDKP